MIIYVTYWAKQSQQFYFQIYSKNILDGFEKNIYPRKLNIGNNEWF